MTSYKDLRGWLDRVDQMGELKRIEGADWNLEIGALSEMIATQSKDRPAILFDKIKGYPAGYRVLSAILGTMPRLALTTGMDVGIGEREFVSEWRLRMRNLPLIPPMLVRDGPVTQNVMEGADIDLFKFPAPWWHEEDGGRYIGTASITITQDPESDWVNLGTYRVMIHDKDTLSFFTAPGRHGAIHREKYFNSGKPCPVAISFGHDPLLFLVASTYMPPYLCEYNIAGGLKGEPIEVIRGEVTGLPLPAHAEIVVEGESLPAEARSEGPFGEYTGYYGSAERPEPTIKVKRVLYRDDPIIAGACPTRPPNDLSFFHNLSNSALIWENLEKAGVPDIRGVCRHEAGHGEFNVVSITQRYPGHARQAALVASQVQGAAYMGKYIVVVDDDIDPADINQVIWAMCTRADPERSCEIIRRCWSGPLEVSAPPGEKGFSSRLIIDACKPYEWKDDFPREVGTSPELEERVLRRFGRDAVFGRGSILE